MTESNTLLVSGGAGYVGSALVSRILRDTNWNVKVFDDLMYGGNSLFQFYNFDILNIHAFLEMALLDGEIKFSD